MKQENGGHFTNEEVKKDVATNGERVNRIVWSKNALRV